MDWSSGCSFGQGYAGEIIEERLREIRRGDENSFEDFSGCIGFGPSVGMGMAVEGRLQVFVYL